MRLRTRVGRHAWRVGLTFLLVLAWAAAMPLPTIAAAEPIQQGGSPLENRVDTLAKALELDAGQQAELRRILEEQRAKLQRIWSDTSIPPAYRVSATRGLSERTADRIRAMLSDEQKKLYNPPRTQHRAPASSHGRSVEDWMRAASPK